MVRGGELSFVAATDENSTVAAISFGYELGKNVKDAQRSIEQLKDTMATAVDVQTLAETVTEDIRTATENVAALQQKVEGDLAEAVARAMNQSESVAHTQERMLACARSGLFFLQDSGECSPDLDHESKLVALENSVRAMNDCAEKGLLYHPGKNECVGMMVPSDAVVCEGTTVGTMRFFEGKRLEVRHIGRPRH